MYCKHNFFKITIAYFLPFINRHKVINLCNFFGYSIFAIDVRVYECEVSQYIISDDVTEETFLITKLLSTKTDYLMTRLLK